jgi:hypothetical protein
MIVINRIKINLNKIEEKKFSKNSVKIYKNYYIVYINNEKNIYLSIM